jgi:phospholipid transport system substrate-binding protein
MVHHHGSPPRLVLWLPAFVAVVVALVVGAHPVPANEPAKGAPPGSRASQARPLELVKSSVSRVLAIVQARPDGAQRRAEIRQVGEVLFDVNEMARRTLAQHWSGRSPQEQEEFVRRFADLLERSYLTALGNYRLAAVTFQGESIEGSSARVRSRVLTDRGVEIPIDYRLLETAGRWAVYDVVVEGVSLISSYRSQFNSVIRTSSFARLLETLQSREAFAGPGASKGP